MFGVMNHVLAEHWQTAEFQSFAVQVMLGEGDSVEAHVFSQTREFGHFIDHALPAFRMARNGAQLAPFFECRGQSRKKKVHKLHSSGLLFRRSSSIARRILKLKTLARERPGRATHLFDAELCRRYRLSQLNV